MKTEQQEKEERLTLREWLNEKASRNAYIIVTANSVHSEYNITIADCNNNINLHGNFSYSKKRAAIAKAQVIIDCMEQLKQFIERNAVVACPQTKTYLQRDNAMDRFDYAVEQGFTETKKAGCMRFASFDYSPNELFELSLTKEGKKYVMKMVNARAVIQQ